MGRATISVKPLCKENNLKRECGGDELGIFGGKYYGVLEIPKQPKLLQISEWIF